MERWISIVSSRDLSCDFFFPWWVSSPINLVDLLVLCWPFYNSKSLSPNRSASSFRKRVLVTLKALIKAFYLAQWLNPPLAAHFFKIFLLAAKTSLLTLPPPKAIHPCHVTCPHSCCCSAGCFCFVFYSPIHGRWPPADFQDRFGF